ncbi:DNA polymerase III subunit delta' [Aquitalea magnusonii]|uniref:DNA polymerase III subunit delta' n=1 Tax=Aquitalea TaxID=407217 RepID=UPI0005F85907|nr:MULTISPECIES: DNA polymerase III subunit delta' [Aquitalea]KJV27993.1 DNA polymerase III subunit delta' [Aquitalea magnusonii]QBJ78593.1 DNA polymerase III subunit delta' [Aquitalea sp. USM4]
MLFPWQEQDWQRLNAERARLPNAWLFIGPAGTGKLEFALHLAQSLLCEQLQADHQPCGQCEACRWFAHGTHPDFRRLSPQTDDEEEGKEAKPGRKLPLIKIEAVREVIEFAHLTAHRAGRRIIVVEPAENLNPAAANALLKILEEPPQDVLFLLVAQAAQRLLPTIRSRCRQFPLSAPTPAQALAWLQQQGVENAATELAHNGGAPLFDHDPVLAKLRSQFIDGLGQPTFASILSLAELVDKQKLPLAIPLGWLMKWLHDLAGLSLAGIVRYHPDKQQVLQALVQRCDPVALMRCQDALQQLAPFGQHTLNTRLQLEALLMDYLKIFAGGRQG